MRGFNKEIERIELSTDIEWLKWKRGDAHRAADIAAIEFNQLVEVENACTARIEELEKGAGGDGS